jgi:hypothetical protein
MSVDQQIDEITLNIYNHFIYILNQVQEFVLYTSG